MQRLDPDARPAVGGPVTPTSRFVQRQSAISAEVDGEVVALDAARGVCFGLNLVGSRVWKLLERPTQAEAICTVLMAEFEVDADTCRSQVTDLLTSLHNEGLIELWPSEADGA